MFDLKSLSLAIARNRTITGLLLEDVNSDAAGGAAIRDMLLQNKMLRSVYFGESCGYFNGAMLADVLRKNTTITVFGVVNHLNDYQLGLVASALDESNFTLLRFEVVNSYIECEEMMLNSIDTSLKRNRSINWWINREKLVEFASVLVRKPKVAHYLILDIFNMYISSIASLPFLAAESVDHYEKVATIQYVRSLYVKHQQCLVETKKQKIC